MDTTGALKIVCALASGADPVTGEAIPQSDLLQREDVRRAMRAARGALLNAVRRAARKARKAAQNTDEAQDPVKAALKEKRESRRAAKVLEMTERGETNAGLRWSEDEDSLLVEAFEAGLPEAEIARAHKRSVNAVHCRLIMLGTIGDDRPEKLREARPLPLLVRPDQREPMTLASGALPATRLAAGTLRPG